MPLYAHKLDMCAYYCPIVSGEADRTVSAVSCTDGLDHR